MPLIHTIQINTGTKIGIWEILEEEAFFRKNGVIPEKQITHPFKRLQHLAGRWLLKVLVPDVALEKIREDEAGRPYCPDSFVEFSVSHSHRYAAVIVSDSTRVGIDIEKINSQTKRIKNKFLKGPELEFLSRNDQSLTLSWSIKEAIYKWEGKKDVSLKKNIEILPFEVRKEGNANVIFRRGHHSENMKAHYFFNNGFVLVWVSDLRDKIF